MKKKFLIVTTLLVAFLFFAVSYTFAANNAGSDAVNGIRNFVGGAENVVENVGTGAVNGIRSGINTLEGGAQNTTNGMTNGVNGMNNNMRTTTTTNNNGYNATRTTATRTTGTTNAGTGIFGNVSNSVWTWMIVGIVGIIIIALVMYYAKQNTNVTTYQGRNDNDDE